MLSFHPLPRRRVAVVVLALALALSGCGGSGAASVTASTGQASSAATSSAAATSSETTASSAATTSTTAATSASTTTSASETTSASAAASTSATASSSAAPSSTSETGSASSAASAASGATTVLVRNDPKLGMILTDAANRTLYWYTKDSPGKSTCTGGCLSVWPPFAATGAPTLPAGVPGKLGTITRSDGSTQVTYDDMPLYYYAKDTAPGDTNGQGVGKVWYVVTPTAGPLTPPAS